MNTAATPPSPVLTGSLVYAVGALLILVGWIAAARLLGLLAKRLGAVGEIERAQNGRALLTTGGLAAGFLLVGSILVRFVGPAPAVPANPGGDGPAILFNLPIVWFVMPWTAWVAVAAIAMIGYRVFQALGAIVPEERRARGLSIIGWAAALGIVLALFCWDPGSKIEILRGALPLTAANVVALALFAAVAVGAMAVSARSLKARGFAKGLATQAALITGSIVFGIPFAFLLITSFKEDKDMTSANGIVWIPKVTRTIPFVDPTNTIYDARMPGENGGFRDVEAAKLKALPNGRVQMEVFKPLSIRGTTFETADTGLKVHPQPAKIVNVKWDGKPARGFVASNLPNGDVRVRVLSPESLKGQEREFRVDQTEDVRDVGLRTENYSEALQYLPPETNYGLVYLQNTLILVVVGVIGTIASSSIVAYAFSRMRFPGKKTLFNILLATMMLPGAVTMLPTFLIFRSLGWIDTLLPLTVPAFFASAFNVFLLRQFFMQIPMELEDAAKIDGCGYLKTFWSIMIPQIKPALTVIAIWTFMGAWNNFMGPLIYINSPEHMPLAYALQLFKSDRGGEPGLLMAFSTMTLAPVLALFFFTQRYFIEGVTLSGLGGR